MTDDLGQRVRALADPIDDSAWLDVRRRARRTRRRPILLAAAAAAAVAAAASLAAGGGWLFSSQERQVTARTEVTLHGRTWTVSLTSRGGVSRFCVRLSQAGRPTISGGCGRGVSRLVGPPFGARRIQVDGGQVWVGETLAFVRRIAITDEQGHVHSTRTIAAPKGTKTPFRYWALALDGPARSIAAQVPDGRTIRKRV